MMINSEALNLFLIFTPRLGFCGSLDEKMENIIPVAKRTHVFNGASLFGPSEWFKTMCIKFTKTKI